AITPKRLEANLSFRLPKVPEATHEASPHDAKSFLSLHPYADDQAGHVTIAKLITASPRRHTKLTHPAPAHGCHGPMTRTTTLIVLLRLNRCNALLGRRSALLASLCVMASLAAPSLASAGELHN